MQSSINAIDDLYINTLGLVRPWQRVAFTFTVAASLQHLIKPTWAYEEGEVRPFIKSIAPDAEDFGSVTPTYVPWWTAPVVLGLISGILI